MPAEEAKMKFLPNFFPAMMKSGTFSMMLIAPTGSPVRRLMICAMPVSPPDTMKLGFMKNWNPAALRAAPSAISRYLVNNDMTGRLSSPFLIKSI